MTAGPAARAPWWLARRGIAATLVVAVAVLAMAPAIANGFTYDDRVIIQDNARVHQLAGWWRLFGQSYWPPPALEALYRPLPMLAYAVQWTLGGGAPWLLHAGNLAAYALLCLAVWRLATELLPPGAALAVGVLFAAHPVHVEPVANIVGLAELGMAFGTVVALGAYLAWRERGPSPGRTLAVVAGAALAAFSKEQGVLVPLVLLLLELTLVTDRRPWWGLVRHGLPLAAALVALLGAYVALRSRAVATWDDAPAGLWMVLSPADRRWTMLGVAAEWGRLLLWPARLAVEYSPPHVPVHRGWSIDLLPGAVVLTGGAALAALSWRRVPVAGFGLGFAAVALLPVANVLVPTGVILAERTLLLPSVGVLLAIGAWAAALWREQPPGPVMRRVAAGGVALLAAAGATRAARRTTTWRDDATLLATAVVETPRSYRPWYLLGQLQVRTGRLADGEASLRRAVALFPDDYGALALLGDLYRRQNRCDQAVPVLERALLVHPDGADARVNLAACAIGLGRFEAARRLAADGERRGIEAGAFRALRRLADSIEVRRGTPAHPSAEPPRPLPSSRPAPTR